MPLSKERDRERWHQRKLQPKVGKLQPNVVGVLEGIEPDSEGYYPSWAVTSWVKFNGKVRQQLLPNSPDGRYH